MSVKISGGLVDDGSSDLFVAAGINTPANVAASAHLVTAVTLAASGIITIPQPGFYYVPVTGSATITGGYFTGTVPNPSQYPGSMLGLTDTGTAGSFNWLLTGSAPVNGRALFVKMSGSFSGAPLPVLGGGTVNMSPSGSIVMVSDGFRWCIMAGSGSAVLAGNNALLT